MTRAGRILFNDLDTREPVAAAGCSRAWRVCETCGAARNATGASCHPLPRRPAREPRAHPAEAPLRLRSPQTPPPRRGRSAPVLSAPPVLSLPGALLRTSCSPLLTFNKSLQARGAINSSERSRLTCLRRGKTNTASSGPFFPAQSGCCVPPRCRVGGTWRLGEEPRHQLWPSPSLRFPQAPGALRQEHSGSLPATGTGIRPTLAACKGNGNGTGLPLCLA